MIGPLTTSPAFNAAFTRFGCISPPSLFAILIR